MTEEKNPYPNPCGPAAVECDHGYDVCPICDKDWLEWQRAHRKKSDEDKRPVSS